MMEKKALDSKSIEKNTRYSRDLRGCSQRKVSEFFCVWVTELA